MISVRSAMCFLTATAALSTAALAGLPAGSGPDTAKLAATLVNQSAGVHEGDIVYIEGGTKDQELLENIAAQVSKAGAFPLLTFGSDRLNRMTFDMTPEKYDTRTPTLGLKLVELTNVMITVDYSENPSLFADVPPARAAARQKAEQAVMQKSLQKGVRMVSLGNGLYPTEATAKEFGISKSQLADIFWAGVNTDPAMLQSTADKLKATLASGNEITITNPNGTNLTAKIQGRTPFASDGVISAEDAKKGGPACQVWLPAGEVYSTVVPGTASGTIVFDHFQFHGKDIPGLKLAVKSGKITDMAARSGIEPLQAAYDAAGTGKDALAFIDIGINPDVKLPQSATAATWVPAGMVSIGFGNDTWAGGTNNANFDLGGHIPGSTLKLDGKTIVDAGTLHQ